MAFNDYTFVKVKMSSSVETVLDYQSFQPDDPLLLINDLTSQGHKVSIRTLNEGHTYSISVTGGNGTEQQGLIVSAFEDTLEGAFKKIEFLLSLQPVGSPNWLSITDNIRAAEKRVNAMLLEYLNK